MFDPATGTLQLVEVKKVTVRSTLRSETEELREERERIEARRNTMTAKRHALAAEFGSKKSRKAIEDITMNAISRGKADDPGAAKDDAVASNVLQGMSDATSAMPTKEQLAAAVDSSKPRPQANLAAENAFEVYTSESVLGKDLLGLIPVKDWVDASNAGQAIDLPSKYVARRMLKLVKENQTKKLKVLRFILLCINFNAALRAKGKGAKLIPPKDKLMATMGEDIPGPVVDAIRRKFASEYEYTPRLLMDALTAPETMICHAGTLTTS